MDPSPPPLTHVGIDVAAQTLAVVRLPPAAAAGPAATVPNTAPGWRQVDADLRAAGCAPAATRLVLEATGTDGVGVATALTQAGWTVGVVSPASAREYAKARLRRAKTAAVDAAVLALYGRAVQPTAWSPPPPEITAWQLLVRQRDDLISLQTATRNRQHALAQLPEVPPEVHAPAAAVLTVLAEQITRLEALIKERAQAAATIADDVARLDALTGVGLLTAAVVVTELWGLGPNVTPKQAVACAGLDPAPRQSGSSVRGEIPISKTGSARLRQALHMAALSAAHHHPVLRPLDERLVARGKPKLLAVTAVARKLLALMVTLMKHKRTFDPDWHARCVRRATTA